VLSAGQHRPAVMPVRYCKGRASRRATHKESAPSDA